MNVGVVCYLPRHMTKLLPVVYKLVSRGVNVHGFYDTRKEPLPKGRVPDEPMQTRLAFEMVGVPTSGYRSVSGLKLQLERNRIQCVVIPETHNLNNVICGGHIVNMCREIGIRTVVVQHGQVIKQSLKAFVPMRADVFCAWGEWTKSKMVSAGADPKKIVVTGYPELDELAGGDADTRKKVAKRVVQILSGISPKSRLCCIMSHVTMNESLLQLICSTVRMNGYEPIVVTPPRDRIEKIGKTRILKGNNPRIFIAAADLCITGPSTIAIECIVLRRPIVIVTGGDEFKVPFPSLGVAAGLNASSATNSTLTKAMSTAMKMCNSRSYKNFCALYLNVDGNAASRVVDVVTWDR